MLNVNFLKMESDQKKLDSAMNVVFTDAQNAIFECDYIWNGFELYSKQTNIEWIAFGLDGLGTEVVYAEYSAIY